jgi:hypothetical protein
VDADAPRWIAKALGYTRSPHMAADRLEAIRSSEQEAQTRAAHLRWSREQRRRWGEAAATITSAVDSFSNGIGLDPRLAADVRAIRRDVARTTQHLDDDLRRAAGRL